MRYLLRPDQTLNRSLARGRSIAGSRSFPRSVVARGIAVAVFFGIAFAVDQLTGQRYSTVLGSAAIVGSVLTLFPGVRLATFALGGYGAIWVGFNLVRAVADDAGLAVADRGVVSSIEAGLFRGALPSAWLQSTFHEPGRVQVHDVGLALVHASFFVTPFAVAVVLWWKRRTLFAQYSQATAFAFGLGLVGFLLLPTAPPWLSNPDSVTRVTVRALSLGAPVGGSPELGFEPNHVAALPSVHVAAAVLVCLALGTDSGRWWIPGAAYAVTMSVAVVYLGEHFLLDALLGWVIALAGWRLARWWAAR